MKKKLKPTVDLGYPTEPRGDIPSFSSIEEEAEFWDTHDSTDFLDSLVPAELVLGPQMKQSVTFQLLQSDREALARIAEREGVEPAELARKWVIEHLRNAEAKVS